MTDLAKTDAVSEGPTPDGRAYALATTSAQTAALTVDAPNVEVRSVSRTFTTKQGTARAALADVNLAVPSGQFLAIIGASGCGKSTLLRLLGGLDRASTGEVVVGGEDPSVVKGRGVIGLVPQSPALLPWKSVAENVALLDNLGPWAGDRVSRPDVDRWLDRVELSNEGDLLPHQLSGGMQQRVSLARAFAIEPSLLLMDEPFNALDEITRHHMQSLLIDLCRLTRPTVVFVTHSIDEAVKLADRVVVMRGTPGTIEADLMIDLERPRQSGVEDTPAFRQHAARVRQALVGPDVADDATEQDISEGGGV